MNSKKTTNTLIDNDIKVNLHFQNTNKNGRKSPVKSGYRTQFHFIDGDLKNSGWTISLQFIGSDQVAPGETIQATGIFLCPEPFKKVNKNTHFELREGAKVVATGEVIDKY